MAKRWPGRSISGPAGSRSLRIPRARPSRSLRARRTTDGDRVLAHFTSAEVTNAKRPVGGTLPRDKARPRSAADCPPRVQRPPPSERLRWRDLRFPQRGLFPHSLLAGAFLYCTAGRARRAGARPSIEPDRSGSARSVVLISLPTHPYGPRVYAAYARRRRAVHPASAASRLPLLGRRSHLPSRSAHRARS